MSRGCGEEHCSYGNNPTFLPLLLPLDPTEMSAGTSAAATGLFRIEWAKEEMHGCALGWCGTGLEITLRSPLDLSVIILGPQLGAEALFSTVNHV